MNVQTYQSSLHDFRPRFNSPLTIGGINVKVESGLRHKEQYKSLPVLHCE